MVYDPTVCVGCRYRMVACPFEILAYEYEEAYTPSVVKCTMCSHRVENGELPGCVEACPTEALIFGKRKILNRCRQQKPEYMPSHKFINSLGIIYKKKGRVTRQELEAMREILWERCVLCTRCYCPLGINIPDLISLARRICRSQGIYHEYNGVIGRTALPTDI